VVRRLVEASSRVVVLHRRRTGASLPDRVGRITGDRRDLRNFVGELRLLAPEVVLDMVPTSERETRDLVDVFRGASSRIVVVSSQDVYQAYNRVTGRDPGPPDPIPPSEDAPLREKLYP
jgi:hypothetical protein